MFFSKKKRSAGKETRILYASDFHGANTFFRKFLAAGLQYKADVLLTGGDLTGKAMIPVVHQGGGTYVGSLFGRREEATTRAELDRLVMAIGNVGFYPIVLEKDEAAALEADPERMASRFEEEMASRIREWLQLYVEKVSPSGVPLYFLPGNDDLFSMDEVIAEFAGHNVHNPDGRCLRLDEHHEIAGVSYSNMTPWKCNRDITEDEMAAKLDALVEGLEAPERAVMIIHIPPYDSGLDVCPELDENLRIMHRGGHVLMQPVGSTAVRAMIERVQPMLTLHGHIHESPGHARIGRTLAINAGSEYAEGIMKAAVINLEEDRVKGHVLISG